MKDEDDCGIKIDDGGGRKCFIKYIYISQNFIVRKKSQYH